MNVFYPIVLFVRQTWQTIRHQLQKTGSLPPRVRFIPGQLVLAQPMLGGISPILGRVNQLSDAVRSLYVLVSTETGLIKCRPEDVELVGTGEFIRFAQWAAQMCQEENLALSPYGTLGHYIIYYGSPNMIDALRLEDNMLFSFDGAVIERLQE